jgi:TPR repeat protein
LAARKGEGDPAGPADPGDASERLAGFSDAATSSKKLGTRLEIDGGELFFTGSIKKDEAINLGNYLVESGFFDGKPKTVQVNRSGAIIEVRMVVKPGMDRNEDEIRVVELFAGELSKAVFKHAPVAIHLCDVKLKTARVVGPVVQLEYNKGDLYYSGSVSRTEATSLGEYLVKDGFFDDSPKTVHLDKNNDVLQFRVVAKKGIIDNEAMIDLFKVMAEQLSQKVFKGAGVEIHICDDTLRTQAVVTANESKRLPPDVERLMRLAESGAAEAQNELGGVFRHGRGVAKDFKAAVKWFRRAADQGNPDAQDNLGLMYEHGMGVDKSEEEAVKLYRAAAEQGDAWGQKHLGFMYDVGHGAPQDFKEAMKWYQLSAGQGNAEAQNQIGEMYYFGKGVEKDFAQAANYYRKAAEQGFAAAQANLGYLYQHGEGVAKDYAEAAKWNKRAADRGNADAQNSLGLLYQRGRGVQKNLETAVIWFRKAAEQDHTWGEYNLGWMYHQGVGVTEDRDEAVKWFRRAAAKGHKPAKERLELMGAE